MKPTQIILLLLFIGYCNVSSFADESIKPSINSTHLSGYIGQRIDACIEKRVIAQDVDHLIQPFQTKNETSLWQTEFWGKWILGAIHAYRYQQKEENVGMAVNSYKPIRLITQWRPVSPSHG